MPFDQWRQGVTANRSGDMANAFGLAEALARQNSAYQANPPSDVYDVIQRMLAGMVPNQPVPGMMIPGGGVQPAEWIRDPTGGFDSSDLAAKRRIAGGAAFMGQNWADEQTATDSAYKQRRSTLQDFYR